MAEGRSFAVHSLLTRQCVPLVEWVAHGGAKGQVLKFDRKLEVSDPTFKLK
jgi:hypothetical protein